MAGSQPSASANAAKKGKQKKATDPNEASKLIAAKISQLELDAAGEKDQEAEIGWFSPFSYISRNMNLTNVPRILRSVVPCEDNCGLAECCV
jgi:hypothetical protein